MSLASTLLQNIFSSSVFQLSLHLRKMQLRKSQRQFASVIQLTKSPLIHVLKNNPEPTAFLVFYLYKLLFYFLCLILLQDSKNSLSRGLQFLIRTYHQSDNNGSHFTEFAINCHFQLIPFFNF